MKIIISAVAIVFLICAVAIWKVYGRKSIVYERTNMPENSIKSYCFQKLNGSDSICFSAFTGKKILIVNVASRCGYTGQYRDLQKLFDKYRDKLVVVGFPCNQFGNQESGTESEIAEFCSSKYDVTFPMASKCDVKGDNIHPVYKWLTDKSLNGVADHNVTWNFNKFLLDEEGKLLAYFSSKVSPLDTDITAFLEN